MDAHYVRAHAAGVMHMTNASKVFLVIWIFCGAVFGWLASFPNEYGRYLPGMEPQGYKGEYYWEYLVMLFVIGAALFSIIWPQGAVRFSRWVISFFFLIAVAFFLAFIGMHAPPVHFYLFSLVVLVALVALFMSGFALGASRKNA